MSVVVSMLSMRSAKSERERERERAWRGRNATGAAKVGSDVTLKFTDYQDPLDFSYFIFFEIVECRMVKGKWRLANGKWNGETFVALGG